MCVYVETMMLDATYTTFATLYEWHMVPNIGKIKRSGPRVKGAISFLHAKDATQKTYKASLLNGLLVGDTHQCVA